MSQTVAVKRATKEFADLQKNSAQHGMRAETINDDLMKWKCWIKGPVGSPYEGGTFELLVVFPTAFPYKPPTVRSLDEH
jgi:ubiquitin-protein ligase